MAEKTPAAPRGTVLTQKGGKTDYAYEFQIDGDAFPRVRITYAGNIFVGDGTANPTTDIAAGGGSSGVASFNTRTGVVTLTGADVNTALGYTAGDAATVATKAADSAVVHNTGNENVGGVKTFTSNPVVPSGAFPESAIASLVGDLAAKAADSAVVHNTGTETIGGAKTFSIAPVVPSASFPESAVTNLTTDLAAKAADAAVVHNTGAENVGGVKTFTSSPVVPANSFPESAVTNLVADLASRASTTSSWAKHSTTQSIPNAAHTAITWDTNVINTLGAHSTSVNPTRFTAPSTGIYEIGCVINFNAANVSTAGYLTFDKNATGGGTFMLGRLDGVNGGLTVNQNTIQGHTVVSLTANDYIVFNAYQASGAAVNLAASDGGGGTIVAYMRQVT